MRWLLTENNMHPTASVEPPRATAPLHQRCRVVDRLFAMHAATQREPRMRCERDAETIAEGTEKGTAESTIEKLWESSAQDTEGTAEQARRREEVDERQEIFYSSLGFMCGAAGHDVDRDVALELVQSSADMGCAAAFAALCLDHEQPLVRKSAFLILRHVSLAVDTRLYNDIMRLCCKTLCARACELGLIDAPENYHFVSEYRQACEAGCVFSGVRCGAALEAQGRLREAYQYYKEAANIGCASAKFHMSRCLKHGVGVQKDEAKALRVLTAAATQKLPAAMHALAAHHMDVACEKKELRHSHDALAFYWFSKVADAHERVMERASGRLQYFCADACPDPHPRLAQCYQEGRGVPQNETMAVHHFAMACADL